MSKKTKINHLYLGVGGMLAVSALVLALTFGLSHAQDMDPCPADPCPGVCCDMPPPPADTDPCPADPCPGVCCDTPPPTTPPPGCMPPPEGCMYGAIWNSSMCVCEGGSPPPPPTCTPPPDGCMMGTWNQSTCMCEGGTYVPPPTGGALCPSGSQYPNVAPPPDKDCYGNTIGGGATGMCASPMPTAPCSNGYYECRNNAWQCVTGTTPPPSGGMCMGTPAPCSAGQRSFCDMSTGAPTWKCEADTYQPYQPPSGGQQCTPPLYSFPGPTGPVCKDPATVPLCTSGGPVTCKPQGWVPPTTTTPPPTTGGVQCGKRPDGQTNFCASGDVCSNATKGWCCPVNMPVTCTDGKCVVSLSQCGTQQTQPTGQCVGAPPSCMGGVSKCENGKWICDSSMRPATCGPNDPSCGTQQPYQPMPYQQPQPGYEFPKPGECPTNMLSCPDRFMPGNSVCKPSKSYDMKTNTPKDMTCDSWAEQEKKQEAQWGTMPGGPMGGPGMMPGMYGPGMQGGPMYGPGMQGGPGYGFGSMPMGDGQNQSMDPCMMNPNDPFCKAGFDFGGMQQQYQFDQNQFKPEQYEFDNTRQEVSNLKREVKEWERDSKDVERQLKEISRESSGFACPVAVEVQTILDQLKNAISTVKSVTEKSSKEEIKQALAMRDFVNGRWEYGAQVSLGLRQKLFGSQDPETGAHVQGKMDGLRICREISGFIMGACDTYKNLNREYERAKKTGAPEVVLKTFAEVIPQLQQRCTNPLAVLQSKGVSFGELTKPWPPMDDPDARDAFEEECGDYMTFGPVYGPGPGGPGFGPGPEGPGYGPGPEGPGYGPMPMPMPMPFGDFSPEMQRMMESKQKEFQQQQQYTPKFNPYGASVLDATWDDEDFVSEEEGDFFGPGSFGPPNIPDQCKPPVQRYLGFDDLMRKMDEARFKAEKHFEEMNVCKMLEMAKSFVANATQEELMGDFGPPQEVVDLIEPGLEACRTGDTKTLSKIKEKMMRFGPGPRPVMPGVGGGMIKGKAMGGMIDIDKLVEDKLREKLGQFFEDREETASSSAIKELEARISSLQAKLDEASKTIIALNEKLSEMATQVASAVELSDKSRTAVGSIAKLPDQTTQQTVATTINDLAIKADEVKKVVPAAADKLVDEVMNSLIQAPPTSAVASDIKDSLTVIQSYAASGAKSSEIVNKVKEEMASIAVLNASDVGNKITANVCATADTCNLGDWFAIPTLAAKQQGFVAAELKEFKPGEAETKCAAVTRVARIMEKAGDLTIDLDNKAPVADAPEWCRPFIHAMQDKDVPFVRNLKDPNATADRLDIAVLLNDAVGGKLPAPPKAENYLTPDVKQLPLEQQMAIAKIRYNGIMDATDGTNFSPNVEFNRAQNALVSTKAFEAVDAAINK